VEILLLSGGTPYANFRDLAHAWGRDKGFHHQIVANVCERRGEVDRKRQGGGARGSLEAKRMSIPVDEVPVDESEDMDESPHDLVTEI
jgi:hypothetical protein